MVFLTTLFFSNRTGKLFVPLIIILSWANIVSAQQSVMIHLADEIDKVIDRYDHTGLVMFNQSSVIADDSHIAQYEYELTTPAQIVTNVQVNRVFFSSKTIRLKSGVIAAANPQLTVLNTKARAVNSALIRFIPGRLSQDGVLTLIDSIEISYTLEKELETRTNPPFFKPFSVLKDGDFYKISTTDEGIYKITDENLKKLGINTNGLDPAKIRLFTTMAGTLPEINNLDRTDDLEEIAISIKGGDDGKWDSGDEIWFYSPGPHKWSLDTDGNWVRSTNIYTNEKYFFIQTGKQQGKRISIADQPGNPEVILNTYLDAQHFEKDEINPLKEEKTIGGGKLWFGDLFYNTFRSKDYSNEFKIDNAITGTTGRIRIAFAARSTSSTQMKYIADGQSKTMNLSSVLLEDENRVADYRTDKSSFIQTGGNLSIKVDFPQVAAESKGWLDFIEINAIRELNKQTGILFFRNPDTIKNIKRYVVGGISQESMIWDLSDPFEITKYSFSVNGGKAEFNVPAYSKFYVVFNPADLKPISTVGQVAAQNLHGMEVPDLLVVYHLDFKNEALEFAKFRSQASGITVSAIDVEQIYNEFSGGAVDPGAIRDFARMFYSRDANKFKNLLLFGNGSYDYRNIGVKTGKYDINTDFIPVYEYESTSLHPIATFPLDDFYCFLDPDEGDPARSRMDIGVGRIPVSSRSEAATIVAKIKQYNVPGNMADWRNNLVLISDDWDAAGSDDFVNQSEKLAVNIENLDPNFNLRKIFADLYQQENLIQGERYPEVVKVINDMINKGALVFNYIGHGGTTKLADEEIVDKTSINQWNNPDKLPLFITGTCSFSIYDDPTVAALGRDCIVRPNGGMIALITTVRSVYIHYNEIIVNRLFKEMLTQENSRHKSLGEILRLTKNAVGGDDARRFVLLGDPSMVLNFPENRVEITEIKGKQIGNSAVDTLQALEKVNIKGQLVNVEGQLISDFNGTVTISVFDKESTLLTRGNDGNGTNTKIPAQNNIIFRGQATVANGIFAIDFVVPKDIKYEIDTSKISAYAENGKSDASGFTHKFFLGGESLHPITDDLPPIINLFLDNESFRNGQTVGATPLLIAKVSDDNGINISGTSIGHDIVYKLNNDENRSKVMNDFFIAEKDSYKSGVVNYQLEKLDPGSYTLSLKAWDVLNNHAESQIEFVVANNGQEAITRLLNYPNPFTTSTSFLFEYESGNQPVLAQIDIYTVSGRLVKSIKETLSPIGKRFQSSVWNGKDDFDGQLAKGVYLYKVKIYNGTKLQSKSDFQKLVLLK